jgi:hypothetical protein
VRSLYRLNILMSQLSHIYKNYAHLSFSGPGAMTGTIGHVSSCFVHPIPTQIQWIWTDFRLVVRCLSISHGFFNPCVCVTQKPAVGQPLHLQTLPLCLLLLLVVLISGAEARLRCLLIHHVSAWQFLVCSY